MTETEFLAHAERALDRVEAALTEAAERAHLDIDANRAGNVLTLGLDNGARLVINSQAAMQQLWVAARSGGHHYALAADGLWRDTRDGSELFASLSKLLTAHGGAPIELQP